VCDASSYPPLLPTRATADKNHVVFISPGSASTATERVLTFPSGYSAWERDGVVKIVSPAGRILGDSDGILRSLGGADGVVCRIDGVVIHP
jgi:hypothetical protein